MDNLSLRLKLSLSNNQGPNLISPSDLPGLVNINDPTEAMFQLNDGTIPVVADNDPVGWTTGGIYTQAIVDKRPLYKTNIKNGRSVLLFDNIDDQLLHAGMSFTNALTFYVAFSSPNPAGNTLFGNSAASGGPWFFVNNVTGKLGLYNDNVAALPGATTVLIGNTWYVLSVSYDGVATSYVVNGIVDGGGAGVTTFTQPVTEIGTIRSGNPLNGYLGYSAIYNQAHSIQEQISMHAYINSLLRIY